MIEFTDKDIFDVRTDAYVNPVNCEGAISAGLALKFKTRYPEMMDEYRRACLTGRLRIGTFNLWKDPDTPWIINLPTKDRWREPSTYPHVVKGLLVLRRCINEARIRSIAIPALGCGKGGLDWRIVKVLIESCLGDLDGIEITVCSPLDGRSLGSISRLAQSCKACALHKTRTQVVSGQGRADATIAFVGEAPGRDEDREGAPLVGKAGEYLKDLCRATGGDGKKCFFTTTVLCRPPNNREPTPEETAACKPRLWVQLKALRPRIIVCVGRTAAIELLGEEHGTEMRFWVGRWIVKDWWGPQYPLIRVIYHPSYLMQHGTPGVGGTIEATRNDLAEIWRMERGRAKRH